MWNWFASRVHFVRSWIISFLVLLALSGVLLRYADDLKEAAGTAGFALLGAAAARALDGMAADRAEQRRAEEKRQRDLDETRRVLYMALAIGAGSYEGRAEIAGTVANALAHHYQVIDQSGAESLAQTLISASGLREETMNLLRDRVREITEELEGKATPRTTSGRGQNHADTAEAGS